MRRSDRTGGTQRHTARIAAPALALALLTALTAALGPIGFGLWGAGSAAASGDSGLSNFIIANPLPGWVPEPTHTLNTVVSFLNGLEDDAVLPSNTNVRTAAGGWHDPSDSSHYLVIALVALRFSGTSTASADTQTKQAAVSALASLCAGGATQKSVHVGSITVIPSSHTLTCTLQKNGSQPFATGWGKSNVLALVLSTQASVSSDQMTLISATEYEHMPADGFAVPAPPATSSDTGLLIGVVAGVVVLGLIAIVLARGRRPARSRTRKPAPTPRAARPAPDEPRPTPRERVKARPAPSRPTRIRKESAKPAPVVRRGVVQRPASLAGGVGPPSAQGTTQPEESPPPQP